MNTDYHCAWISHFTWKAGLFVSICHPRYLFRKAVLADLSPLTKYLLLWWSTTEVDNEDFPIPLFVPPITRIHWLLESILCQIIFYLFVCRCVSVCISDTRIVHSFKYWMDIEKCLLLLKVGRKLCRLWGVQKLPIFLFVWLTPEWY